MNYEQAREKMVDCQIRPCDVTDHPLLEAFLSVPREEFVEEEIRELAYLDRDIALEGGNSERHMMSAAPLSRLLQLLAPQSDNIALVVGTGNGYASAVLSLMVSSVVGIEADDALAEYASENLSRLGFDNVAILAGDPQEGCEREAPFDVVLIEGAVEEVPGALLDQLSETGRLVAVVGSGNAAQATLFNKNDGIVGRREVFNCAIPSLPGFERDIEFTF